MKIRSEPSRGSSRMALKVWAYQDLKREHFMSLRQMVKYWNDPPKELYGLQMASRWFKRGRRRNAMRYVK